MEQTTNTRPSVKIKGRRGSCMADVMWPSGKQALPCLHQKLFKVDENGLGYYYDPWTSESKQFTKRCGIAPAAPVGRRDLRSLVYLINAGFLVSGRDEVTPEVTLADAVLIPVGVGHINTADACSNDRTNQFLSKATHRGRNGGPLSTTCGDKGFNGGLCLNVTSGRRAP